MDSFSIVDERKDVSAMQPIAGFFAKPGTRSEASPPLSKVQRSLIKSEILKYIDNKGDRYNITVYIVKAQKAFRSAWPRKYETAAVALKIKFKGEDGVSIYAAETLLEVKSIKATDEYIEKLYQKAIKDCIYDCFVTMKREKGCSVE